MEQHSAVVPGARDAESVALHKDHVGMAKFGREDDCDFKIVASHLFGMAKAAPLKTGENWERFLRIEGVYSWIVWSEMF